MWVEGPFASTHVSVTNLNPGRHRSQINKIVNINGLLVVVIGFSGNEYRSRQRGFYLIACFDRLAALAWRAAAARRKSPFREGMTWIARVYCLVASFR